MIAYFLLLVVAYECSFTHIKGIVLLTIVLLNPNMYPLYTSYRGYNYDSIFFITCGGL